MPASCVSIAARPHENNNCTSSHPAKEIISEAPLREKLGNGYPVGGVLSGT